MRESFVIHAEYIEDLPDEYKDTYLHYIYNYGIYDEEPEGLSGFEKSIWIKIKRRINQDRQAYEERKEKNRKRQEEWRKRKESENEKTETIETPETAETPVRQTPSQVEFSKQIFNIFKDNDLPCAKKNEISFLQTDFMLGLSYLHNSQEYKHLHSDDILEACRNYVEVLNDPSCYVSSKYSFFSFVKSKLFYNLLPANYSKDNFKNFKTEKATSKPESKKWYEDKPCPVCKEKRVLWVNDLNKYKCEKCGNLESFESWNR